VAERMQAIRRTTLAATLLTCVSLIVLIAPPDRADGTTSLGAARRSVEPSRAASGLTPASTSLSGVSQVTSGLGHTCALLLVGQVRCWGDNSDGQLAIGTVDTSLHLSPETVRQSGGTPYVGAVAVSVGGSTGSAHHACALRADSRAECWGRNLSGQLGRNFLSNREPVPGPVVAPDNDPVPFGELSTGGTRSLGFDVGPGGGLRRWGAGAIVTPTDVPGV